MRSLAKKAARFEALIELGGSDLSASEWIATKATPRAQYEERRIVEHLAASFAGTRAPAPQWPRMPGDRLRVTLDRIPWSKLSPDVLAEIARPSAAPLI